MNPYRQNGFELRTEDGLHIWQPRTDELAALITSLSAPGRTFVSITPVPHREWYAEVTLPAECVIFKGPYVMHFQDDTAEPSKFSICGDDPQAMAIRILTWVHSKVKFRQ